MNLIRMGFTQRDIFFYNRSNLNLIRIFFIVLFYLSFYPAAGDSYKMDKITIKQLSCNKPLFKIAKKIWAFPPGLEQTL